jgi:hypothetical protein
LVRRRYTAADLDDVYAPGDGSRRSLRSRRGG